MTNTVWVEFNCLREAIKVSDQASVDLLRKKGFRLTEEVSDSGEKVYVARMPDPARMTTEQRARWEAVHKGSVGRC